MGSKGVHQSKINWTQLVAMLAMFATMFGFELSAETQAGIVTAIGLASQVFTFVLRTWFSGTEIDV